MEHKMSARIPLHTLIDETAYLVTLSTFFGVAIIAAISRTVIRIYKFRRLFVDDCFLFLAVAALAGNAGLFYAAEPGLYMFDTIVAGVLIPPVDFFQRAVNTVTYGSTGLVMGWITIFAVKFSFLFYFRTLVNRIHNLNTWWWCVFVVCIPVAFMNIFGTFIFCPYVGSALLTCVLAPTFIPRERGILYYSVISDAITDVLIISIPVRLLWQAQFSMRQKFSIGVVLCLSVFMIAIAMVRGISARAYGSDDQVWDSLWFEIEACVSVLTVSMTAFRTLFVMPRRSQRKRPSDESPLWRKIASSKKSKKQDMSLLPEIEGGATMTGMRTMIRENGMTMPGSFDRYSV